MAHLPESQLSSWTLRSIRFPSWANYAWSAYRD